MHASNVPSQTTYNIPGASQEGLSTPGPINATFWITVGGFYRDILCITSLGCHKRLTRNKYLVGCSLDIPKIHTACCKEWAPGNTFLERT